MRWLLCLGWGLLGSAPSSRPSAAMSASTHSRSRWVDCGAVLEQRARVAVAAARVPSGARARGGRRARRGGARAARGAPSGSRWRQNASFSAKVRSSSPACRRRASSCAKRASPCSVMRYALRVRRVAFGGRRWRAAARSPSSEPVAGIGAATGVGVDDLDRAVALEPAQRRVERAVGDAPERAERLAEALLQLVAVERLLLQRVRGWRARACGSASRSESCDVDISIRYIECEYTRG